ncbi:MAG: ImmA/IrrE family metallo-endopeptidase [Bacteroidales bacterium]|nr:ImmA/IrrE family metallo-endopeptidase [Bacteroidales bacterium]
MNTEYIGQNIRRLMKINGLSIAKLAENMDVGTATISNILNAKSEPKSSTLLKFSDALGVNLNDLLSEPPHLDRLRFRTQKTLSAREKAEREQMLMSTAQWLDGYKELEDMLGDRIEYAFADVKSKKPELLALEARNLLGLEDNTKPVCDIGEKIENAGIKLGICNFKFKKTFGLSISSMDKGPAIIINSEPSITMERQIFTVIHELGHLLLHSNSYDDIEKVVDKQEEHEADVFAGHFLLPDDALKKEWNASLGSYWIDAVLKIKRIYGVSYKTVLVRLSQINSKFVLSNLLQSFYKEYEQKYGHNLKNHFEPNALEDPVAEEDPYSLNSYELMEARYMKLVRTAYERELISMSRAGELLHKSISEMRELVKSWRSISLHV